MTAIGPTVKYHIHTTCLPTGWSSLYKYTAELICLDSYRPSQEHHCQALMAVTTPLSLPAWEQALSSHPDRAFAQYICRSLHHGFRIDLPVHPPGYALERHDIIVDPPPPKNFNSVADALSLAPGAIRGLTFVPLLRRPHHGSHSRPPTVSAFL